MCMYPRKKMVRILGREPGDIGEKGLLPKPGLLSFGEAASRSYRLGDGSIEGPFLLQVTCELLIPDRLECRKARIETPAEQPDDLAKPARLQHPSHAARDSIV